MYKILSDYIDKYVTHYLFRFLGIFHRILGYPEGIKMIEMDKILKYLAD